MDHVKLRSRSKHQTHRRGERDLLLARQIADDAGALYLAGVGRADTAHALRAVFFFVLGRCGLFRLHAVAVRHRSVA